MFPFLFICYFYFAFSSLLHLQVSEKSMMKGIEFLRPGWKNKWKNKASLKLNIANLAVSYRAPFRKNDLCSTFSTYEIFAHPIVYPFCVTSNTA